MMLVRFLIIVCSIALIPTTSKSQRSSRMEISQQTMYLDANQKKLLQDYDEAIKLYQKILSEDDNHSASHYDLARIYLYQNDITNAIAHAKKSLRFDTQNQWYALTLSECYAADEDFENQAKTLQKITDYYKSSDLYDRLIGSWIDAEKPQQVVKTTHDAMNQYGMKEHWVDQLLAIYEFQSDSDSATELLEDYIARSPRQEEGYIKAADHYLRMEKHQEALGHYRKAFEINPYNEYVSNHIALLESGETASWQSILTDDRISEDTKIETILDQISAFTSDSEINGVEWQNLYQITQQLSTQYPMSSKIAQLLGDISAMQFSWSEAIKGYDKAVTLKKSEFRSWRGLMHALLQQMEMDRLERVAQTCLDYFPNQAAPYYYYGMSMVAKKEIDQAREYLSEATLMSGSNDQMKYSLTTLRALILAEENQMQEAIDLLLTLDNDHKDAIVLRTLAVLYFQNNDTSKAKEYGAKAIEAGAATDIINTLIKA